MFITDIRKDFFDLLQHERILLVANIDVDSVCAIKILQTLLQCDNVLYTLVPIQGKSDLIQAFEDNVGGGSGVRYVVMINCGASVDLVEFLDPPEDLVIFVADSHRPIDVCNIYNDGQIRLVMKGEEEDDIPDYETVFRDDSDAEDNGDDDDENADDNNVKKGRFDETSILKRRDRRIWEDQRAKILFEYQQFSYTGPSTAVLLYELAWKMSRDTNDLLWWAIVGHTEQLLMLKSEADKYLIGTGNLRDHVSRLNALTSVGESGDTRAIGSMKLTFDKELNLNMYRHWSIYESIRHTVYTAAKFKMWTLKGKAKLSEFLAELGLPLVQCKQKFSTMDLELRNNVRTMFEEKAEKYALDDITYNSFIASFGFRHKFCAADIVFAIISLLEQQQVD
jgi:cell division control protein 45